MDRGRNSDRIDNGHNEEGANSGNVSNFTFVPDGPGTTAVRCPLWMTTLNLKAWKESR